MFLMKSTKMHQTDTGISRVTISLGADVYEKVRELSRRMGLRPSSWMAMIISTHVNDVDVEIHRGEKQ